MTTRAYNFPVHQSRHPAVCDWINSSIASISVLLQKGSVKRIAVPIFDDTGEVMERFMFDVERFPVVGEKERWTEFEGRVEGEQAGVKRADVEEQLRGTIRRLDYACSKLAPLPGGCTFSVAVELRDEAEVPIGHPQPWIPSEPSLQTGDKAGSETVGKDLGGVKSTPVRLVEAGEFILETWVEEGRAKFDYDGIGRDRASLAGEPRVPGPVYRIFSLENVYRRASGGLVTKCNGLSVLASTGSRGYLGSTKLCVS
ncbi:MUS26 [Diplocarpon mali]|nr:MUS26 [Diplocarpon mali]